MQLEKSFPREDETSLYLVNLVTFSLTFYDRPHLTFLELNYFNFVQKIIKEFTF